MIKRFIYTKVKDALERQPAVAIIGPRQVGKTTLALQIAKDRPSIYLDLESYEDRDKLSDPLLFFQQYEDHLIILDEIHRIPEIFQTLRGVIDKGRQKGLKVGRFLILGSASIDLLKQSGETLAGRLSYIDMSPLLLLEVGFENMKELWARGGFPDSFLSQTDKESFQIRKDFIRTYLEREVKQFGARMPAETLERLWIMLAHCQGTLLNSSRIASSLNIATKTVTSYIDLLADLFLVRRLKPFHSNVGKRLIKSPKTYICDSGILHALLSIKNYSELFGNPILGKSWEGFVIENILSVIPHGIQSSFYRTSAGAEIDLLLEISHKEIWAIEIKSGLTAKPSKGFHLATKDVKSTKKFVVYAGDNDFSITSDIKAVSLWSMVNKVKNLE